MLEIELKLRDLMNEKKLAPENAVLLVRHVRLGVIHLEEVLGK